MKNNILIAKFMELPYNDSSLAFYVTEPGYGTWLFSDELLYHKSWDWLMPVVEKIELINETTERYGTLCTIHTNYIKVGHIELDHKNKDFSSKIEGVYIAVVKFIKWYNKQKK